MMDNKKSYYAIIPANVRYDKRLNANAKLLFGELTALSNEKGYCWASNSYFAELYEVSTTSISSWVKRLKDCGYIDVKMFYKEGTKEILHRYISILTDPMQENLQTPIQENLKDNTTLYNTTVNITKEEYPAEVITLTNYFYNKMLKPTKLLNKPPDLIKWFDSIDKLHRIDGISYDLIKTVIDKATTDKFWKTQIQSTYNLREKFNRLELLSDITSKDKNESQKADEQYERLKDFIRV